MTDQLTKLSLEEKICFVRQHRGPIAINCTGKKDWTLYFNTVEGESRRLIDEDFVSLINRAYVITEVEVRSWGQ